MKNPMEHRGIVLFVLSCILSLVVGGSNSLYSQAVGPPFYDKADYDPEIASPALFTGFEIGHKPVSHRDIVSYFKQLESQSPRVRLSVIGKTHEGRDLAILIIGSETRIQKLDEIQSNLALLSDPRRYPSEKRLKNLVEQTPAVAWMMYNVHGNELSGADASVQLAYHLAAGRDSGTNKILENLLIVIDPVQNPDGRERTLHQKRQWSGHVISDDVQSLQHIGSWPSGRGNHYLFDMNRDWFIGSQPETRARVKALVSWNPQLVIDAHEMGSSSTYFFNPPREPVNLQIHPNIRKWWSVFAQDQSAAFDRYGWSYYTSESFDEWYPGYGSSWPYFLGAISILYEQASTGGSRVLRPEGITLTFREAVHHQFISSLANLETASGHRVSLIQDFIQIKRDALKKRGEQECACYIIDPGHNPDRMKKLARMLSSQGIEIQKAEKEFRMNDVTGYWEDRIMTKRFPAGSLIISLNQPLKPLIINLIGFDQRLTTSFLKEERLYLEKGKGTRMYEVGAWSMPMAYGLNTFEADGIPDVALAAFQGDEEKPGSGFSETQKTYAFLLDYQDDTTVDALMSILKQGLKVRAARKPFRIQGKSFSRGSLLLRTAENPGSLADSLKRISRLTGAVMTATPTALSETGPDLGSGEFQLLTRPRIALVTDRRISSTNFAPVWYMLDVELEFPHSILHAEYLSNLDLRKYNVLILPSSGSYSKILGKSGVQTIKTWVQNGGTLIALGSGAAFMADSVSGFSLTALFRQSLKQLDAFERALKNERRIGKTVIDSAKFWSGDPFDRPVKTEKKEKADPKLLAEQDNYRRRFMPRGAILRVDLDEEHWLNFGMGSRIPALVYTSYAFLSKPPIQTAARFSDANTLRLSGLLWPEARKRWSGTAYATRESIGRGQVILFAGEPHYRAYFHGTQRMLINAVFLGPGLGSRAHPLY